MLNRINITIGILALMAVFSFLTFLDTLGGINLRADITSILGFTSLAPIEADQDNDGLSNSEESYWQTDFMNQDTDGDGFLDGEEVVSGHNPRIRGPNDLLVTNLTKGTSEIIASGIVEGSLKPDSENYTSSLTTLINDVENQFELSIAPESYSPKIVPTEDITVKKYANELSLLEEMADKENYRIMKLYNIILETGLFDGKIKISDSNHDKFQNFMSKEMMDMRSDIENLKAIEVPDKFKTIHVNIVYLFERIYKSYESLRLSGQDPIRASFSFMNIFGLFTEDFPILLQEQLLLIKSIKP